MLVIVAPLFAGNRTESVDWQSWGRMGRKTGFPSLRRSENRSSAKPNTVARTCALEHQGLKVC